ncbi:hypothetical protein [Amedibacillus sp. YH-ame10]
MTWNDYEVKQRHGNLTVGLLDGIYVLERKVQSGMASDFYKLDKNEYETFYEWCSDEQKILEIRLRKVWTRGFFRTSEFRLMNE